VKIGRICHSCCQILNVRH